MGLTRRDMERKYKAMRVQIVHNIGGGGRWSVEVPNGVLGLCDTLLEAETLIEDAITQRSEEAEEARMIKGDDE